MRFKNGRMVPLYDMEDFGADDGTDEQLGGGSASEGPAEPEFTWDGTKNVLKYGEEEIDGSRFKTIFTDHQNKDKWQKSNTEFRQNLQQQAGELKRVQMLDDLLKNHPEQYGKIEAIVKELNSGVQAQQGQSMIPPELQQKINSLEQFKSSMEDREAASELQREISEIKTKYSDWFKSDPELERKVIQYAYDNKIDNVVRAFRDFMFDKVQERKLAEGQTRLNEAQGKRRNLSIPSGSRGGSSKMDMKGKTLNDLRDIISNDPEIPEI